MKIPEIVDALSAMETPVVDRSVCEKLFGLRRRRTRDLMRHFAGYRCGNAMLVDRLALIHALKQISESPDAVEERERQQKLAAELDRLQRHHAAARVRIPVSADTQDRTVQDLPAGVRLEAGRLTIEFNGALQLLSYLYEISQTASNDYDSFRRAVEADSAA